MTVFAKFCAANRVFVPVTVKAKLIVSDPDPPLIVIAPAGM